MLSRQLPAKRLGNRAKMRFGRFGVTDLQRRSIGVIDHAHNIFGRSFRHGGYYARDGRSL